METSKYDAIRFRDKEFDNDYLVVLELRDISDAQEDDDTITYENVDGLYFIAVKDSIENVKVEYKLNEQGYLSRFVDGIEVE